MKKNKMFFMLYASCIPVKGLRRSIICDLQRQTYHFIPNSLFNILDNSDYVDYEKVKDEFINDLDVLNSYFDFLIKEELGHWSSEPELFSNLNIGFECPEKITNAIIDVNGGSKHNFKFLASQLDKLGCKFLQLRFFKSLKLTDLMTVLSDFKYSKLRHIDILLRHNSEFTKQSIVQLCEDEQRLNTIVFYGSRKNSYFFIQRFSVYVYHQQEILKNSSCCGQVNNNYFCSNLQHFTEAKEFNSCLNKKISIDVNGEIKNCPSMQTSFGNIDNKSLIDALMEPRFKEIWGLNKDLIATCKDCEFRYICTDCRAYIENPDDIYSKPLKCGYDPRTAEWEDWSQHPAKQRAIKQYELSEI